jgi:hypothetical protein
MATKPKTTTSAGTTMSPMDMVQNPNFSSLMRNQDYFNTLAQLVADRQARGEMPGLMPIGGTGITEEQKKRLSPEERRNLDEAIAMRQSGLGGPNYQAPNRPIATTGSAMPQVNPQLEQAMMAAAEQQRNFATQMPINGQNATAYQANADGSMTPVRLPNPIRGDQSRPRPVVAQPNFQIPQMPQMQNYNQMLQQGMRRNQDMNQAVQNLAAPAGPARSFSQVAGGTRRMNRMPRQPRNNLLAPSNQKLI